MLARTGCYCKVMDLVIDLKIWLKLQIPYYHKLNERLLGATNGNRGQTVIYYQRSKTINHLYWVYDLKIWLKLQISYYHPLNQWLLGATNGNQGHTVMHI